MRTDAKAVVAVLIAASVSLAVGLGGIAGAQEHPGTSNSNPSLSLPSAWVIERAPVAEPEPPNSAAPAPQPELPAPAEQDGAAGSSESGESSGSSAGPPGDFPTG